MLLSEILRNDATTIESAWLRSWFGDSKVTNADGQPLIVYHGTSDLRFKQFKLKGGMGGAMGFWFASTSMAASQFARDRFAGVKPGIKFCVLRIINPKQYDGYSEYIDAVKAKRAGSIEDGAKALRRALIRNGYDGVVIRNSDTDLGGVRDDWVAFDAKQIMILNQGVPDVSAH